MGISTGVTKEANVATASSATNSAMTARQSVRGCVQPIHHSCLLASPS